MDPTTDWLTRLQARHTRDLTFAEVRRAVQALSSLYVERRKQLNAGAVFDSAGKRAAFAMYYGPLHYLLVRQIVASLGAADPAPRRLLDLGCGTGVAGAAWAVEASRGPTVEGIDRSGWALEEARFTLSALGVRGSVRRGDVLALEAKPADAIVAAFTVNELEAGVRERLLARLLDAARKRARVLVIEPISRRTAPWWDGWAQASRAAGGREDEWRFRVALPETLALMDRAAGLDHRELTGRSLWLAPAQKK